MNGPVYSPTQMYQQILRNLHSLEEVTKCACQRSHNSSLSKQLFLTLTLNISYLEQLSKQERSDQELDKEKMLEAVKEKDSLMESNAKLSEKVKELEEAN